MYIYVLLMSECVGAWLCKVGESVDCVDVGQVIG